MGSCLVGTITDRKSISSKLLILIQHLSNYYYDLVKSLLVDLDGSTYSVGFGFQFLVEMT